MGFIWCGLEGRRLKLELRIESSGFRVQSSEFRVQSSEFRVRGSEFRIYGLRFAGLVGLACLNL